MRADGRTPGLPEPLGGRMTRRQQVAAANHASRRSEQVTTNVGTRAVRTGRRRVSYFERDASALRRPRRRTHRRRVLGAAPRFPGALTRVTATAGRGGRSERIEGAAASPPSRRSRTRPAHREFRCSGTTDRGGEASLNWAVGAHAEICAHAHRILRLTQLVGQATQSCRVSRGHAPTGSGVRSILCERGWLTIRQRLHHHARVEVAPVVRAPVPKRFSRWSPSNQS